jgi:hypothetical protein
LSAEADKAISVTLKRLKWALTFGSPDTISATTGSTTVFEDGVNIPSLAARVGKIPHSGNWAGKASSLASQIERPWDFDQLL